MAPQSRTRLLDKSKSNVGYANRPRLGIFSEQVAEHFDTKVTKDVIGNYPNANAFNSVHRREEWPVLDGDFYNGFHASVDRQFVNCTIGYRPQATPPLISALPPAMDANALGRMAIVQTNPWSADVNLPAFVGELRDFPTLLRHFGATSIRAFKRRLKELRATFSSPAQAARLQAETNLLWRFGIAPMVGDLAKLLDFQASVARRLDVMQRMEKNGGIKRRFRIGTVDVTNLVAETRTIESRMTVLLKGREVLNAERQQWSTVRWSFKYDKWRLPKDEAAKARLARRLVLGMTAHGLIETMWELTPWSWLIDWFYDVGSFLKRHNNTIPIVPSNVCVMTRTRNTRYIVPTNVPDWLTLTGAYQATWIEKDRKVVSPELADLPECKMPFLTVGQLSILGSLAVTRMVTGR